METTTKQIEDIKEMIGRLSANRLQEVHDFIAFLLEKERKHKAFVEQVLKAEQETPIRFESAEEALQAIIDESKKD
jgi:hypothetical protein